MKERIVLLSWYALIHCPWQNYPLTQSASDTYHYYFTCLTSLSDLYNSDPRLGIWLEIVNSEASLGRDVRPVIKINAFQNYVEFIYMNWADEGFPWILVPNRSTFFPGVPFLNSSWANKIQKCWSIGEKVGHCGSKRNTMDCLSARTVERWMKGLFQGWVYRIRN